MACMLERCLLLTADALTVTPTAAPSTGGGATEMLPWIIAGVSLAAVLALAAALAVVSRRLRRRRSCSAVRPVTEQLPTAAEATVLKVGKLHEQGMREDQQDCFAVSPEELEKEHGLLAVVADGMGGLTDGAKVSRTAVSAMLDGFCSVGGEPQLVLLELLRRANDAVNGMLEADGGKKGGSTLVAALARGGRLSWLTVGDSRISMLRDGELYQLNREHVYRNELLVDAANGLESFESALTNPRASGLTSYLGMGRLRYVDMPARAVNIRPGDRFVLMSDGVYNALGDGELRSALAAPAQDAADEIGRRIAEKGYKGQDNYTAVIIEAAAVGERG